ncbi:MAG: hypothetical protein ACLQVI_18435 [Polyangiaceae bacterium]
MRKPWGFALVSVLVAGACIGTACGSSSPNGATKPGGSNATDAAGDGGSFVLGVGDSGPTQLVIQPSNPTLAVNAAGVTLQFTALLGTTSTPALWSIGAAGVGSIDSNGLFTASGLIGGLVPVTATAAGQTATTNLTIDLTIVENPGNVNAGLQGSLQAGESPDGGADPAFAWLYPYDTTIFPRDVPAPTMQFGGTGFDAAMVQVTFPGLSYTGFYGASTPGRVQFSAVAWNAITGSAGGSASVQVQVTKSSAGVVSGPITESWTIAQGSLAGSIYYNSYNSAVANNTGAVLKLRPGEAAPTVVIPTNVDGECHVCHAVSANGTIMEAANELVSGEYDASAPPTDGVYDLTSNGALIITEPNRTWDFGAFYPDGTKFLRYGAVPWTGGVAWAPDVRGLGNPTTDVPSALFNPRTGAQIPAPGLDDGGVGGGPLNMMMPAFSPDGKEVAFTHYDTGLGHTIAVMDFDNTTNTFSNLRDVATVPSTLYAGWPTFTPDDLYLFFAGGTSDEYDSMSDSPPTPPQPTSNIYIAHIPSKTIATADQLNGLIAGKVYLPFPDDPNLNFEPTILPVAAGGYYWVVFTSRRNYGNIVNGDPYVGTGGEPSPRKKLWVAAISIAANGGETPPVTAAADVTHPAFYLDGQEVTAGNMRAFWALDPCLQTGTTCSTGDQCCTGFCRQQTEDDGGIAFSCVVAPTGCSQANEKCTTSADCCGVSAGYQCINGFCSAPSPK